MTIDLGTDAGSAGSGELVDKGLKSGALGLLSSTVVAIASVAPAYSLASSLGFVVVLIGVSAPVVTILAFVPMLLISLGYKELNRADPDCGTTFTWATRAFTSFRYASCTSAVACRLFSDPSCRT